MTKFEVICSYCLAKEIPIPMYGMEICEVCGHDVDECILKVVV